MEKLFLGISFGFNSSACLYSSERGLIKCVSEERFIRKKNTKEFPYNAIKFCLEGVNKIEAVCVSHYEKLTPEYFKKYCSLNLSDWRNYINYLLNSNNIESTKIIRMNHHISHAYSPFGFYKKEEKYYLVSSDGFGDGMSAQILDENNNIISFKTLSQSIGLVYQFVTGALGFKEHEHEGKITGLAAHGTPKYFNNICSVFDIHDTSNIKYIGDILDSEKDQSITSPIIDFDIFLSMKRNIYKIVKDLLNNGAEMKDIAASVQYFAEYFTIEWLKKYCLEKKAVYLSGGLFANVKLNQHIKDSGLFTNVYVCPSMGDEGTCVGACIYYCYEKYNEIVDGKFLNVYGGMCPNTNNINEKQYNEDELIDKIIDTINNKKVVCLVRGSMEFGPRALCHRSILCDASDYEINDNLNKRLGRTEFMPFAPVCAEEFANDLFINFNGGEKSAKFMTMTFTGTQEFIDNYKGVCHIDHTARPQCINKNENPFMHKLLMEYYKKTGKKCLINTSYNLHGEPIIDNTTSAINSFKKANLDLLIIENYVLTNK